jgi:hypothetical protein
MFTILGYLRDLSAPRLTHVSVQVRDDDFDNGLGLHVAIFRGSAPLLRTVHLYGVTLLNFPPATIVELEWDARNMFGSMNSKAFTYTPNLRALDIRGSFLHIGGYHPISLPMLERLTWGCGSIEHLFKTIFTPALQYLCLAISPDLGHKAENDRQHFPDAITDCLAFSYYPT